jgi:hypothetical protein
MRTFTASLFSYSHHENRKMIGKASKIVVADSAKGDDSEEILSRAVAIFPVTDAHPEDEQTVLAETLTKFLNARVEAMEKAIEHDALLQRIIQ